jgi:hypothetical protein
VVYANSPRSRYTVAALSAVLAAAFEVVYVGRYVAHGGLGLGLIWLAVLFLAGEVICLLIRPLYT